MTPVQSVVCWKWAPPKGYRSQFGPETVNTLRRMVLRHYPHPHRFLCVTDDPVGLDPEVIVVPDFGDFVGLPSPHGGRNPSCYRRLRLFHPRASFWFGTRFVSLDLDIVITGDLTALWHRPEDVVLYGDTNPTTHYNGSMVLLTAGSRAHVWNDFDPVQSPKLAKARGFFGSDQAWLSYSLGESEAKWTRRDGVYSFRNELSHSRALPRDAKVVVFHGQHDPWAHGTRMRYPWVKQHYDMAASA